MHVLYFIKCLLYLMCPCCLQNDVQFAISTYSKKHILYLMCGLYLFEFRAHDWAVPLQPFKEGG
jgi:hypothetical protein